MLSVPRAAIRRPILASLYASHSGQQSLIFTPLVQTRTISSNDVFNMETSRNFSIPDVPLAPEPVKSVAELVEAGQSVLEELGLWSWYKPSSYLRIALESIHVHADIPWWTTIICATVFLRLSLFYVPVLSQRLVAKQLQYKTELDVFRKKMQVAAVEGNNMMRQEVFLEQREFLKSKDIHLGRQFFIMMANGGVFATQFFALKKMIQVNYPGLSTGGTAWFTDLTVCDPYYALPMISAVTMAIVVKAGIEMGTSTDQMVPAMRLAMQYGLPVFIFVVSSQFASGLCVYWCTSNMMSLMFAGVFKIPAVRKILNIAPIAHHSKPEKSEPGTWKQLMESRKAGSRAPPSLKTLKERDLAQFKKAGRGKPIVNQTGKG